MLTLRQADAAGLVERLRNAPAASAALMNACLLGFMHPHTRLPLIELGGQARDRLAEVPRLRR
jgi:hypothetical protein